MFLSMILKLSLFFTIFVSHLILADHEDSQKAYEYMDNLAILAQTDKSSSSHNYTKVYSKYFDSLKNDKIKFLEIGIYKGESVKLWESYFANGDLNFIDISPNMIEYQSTRSKYHFVDQGNPVALNYIANTIGGEFDIIIDDGGHTMTQQIVSFQVLFPRVKSGGLYIIEDLHTSYWKEYGGHGTIGKPAVGPGTCVEFLKALVDSLNHTAGVTSCADFNKTPADLKNSLNYYQSHIDSIHFYQSVCIIIKK